MSFGNFRNFIYLILGILVAAGFAAVDTIQAHTKTDPDIPSRTLKVSKLSRAKLMSEVSTIFTTLDAPFQNFQKEVDPIVWQSSDTVVMQTYDLKVPVSAGSTVKYSFSTKLGDISFSTEFHSAGQVNLLI